MLGGWRYGATKNSIFITFSWVIPHSNTYTNAYKAVLWNRTYTNLQNLTDLIISAGLKLLFLTSVKIRMLKPRKTKTSIYLFRAIQHVELSENLNPVKYLFFKLYLPYLAHSCHPLYYGFTHCYITLVDNTATTYRMLREPYWWK